MVPRIPNGTGSRTREWRGGLTAADWTGLLPAGLSPAPGSDGMSSSSLRQFELFGVWCQVSQFQLSQFMFYNFLNCLQAAGTCYRSWLCVQVHSCSFFREADEAVIHAVVWHCEVKFKSDSSHLVSLLTHRCDATYLPHSPSPPLQFDIILATKSTFDQKVWSWYVLWK